MNLLLLKPINTQSLLIILAIIACISIIFAILIIVISKLCKVPKNEKVEKIQEHLAGANCGGCGFAGCADFAKALFEGKAPLEGCGPTSNENKKIISDILGIPFVEKESNYAVVHCAGGKLSLNQYLYVGNEGCISQSAILDGTKMCHEGCVGGGTCQAVCPHNAIKIKDGVSYTNKALCEACGVCVIKCPKNIIELIPQSSKIYVACSSKCKGKQVIDNCKVGCIGCGLCAKNCPENAITMINNVPKIDYSKCIGCKICVNKCPRKCIKEI